MPPYDPNAGRDPERDPFRLFGRRLSGLGDWLFTPSERQGFGATPYLPDVGEGVSPAEVGQKKALGVDMTQPTYPPQTPRAPSTARPQGGSPETPNTPTPRSPMFRDVESGASSTATPMEVGQKQALGVGSHIRYKEAGGDWQDYDRGTMEEMGRGGYIDSAVGANASPEEWRSRVANPEAFSSYGESLDRVAQDAQLAAQRKLAQDPFAAERFKTDEGIRLEQGRQGAVLGAEEQRRGAFMADVDMALRGEREALIGKLRSTPGWARLSPSEQMQREALIDQHIKNKRDAQIGRQYAFGQKSNQKAAYEDVLGENS